MGKKQAVNIHKSNLFSATNLIDKKKCRHELTADEIKFFVNGLLLKKVADYQMTAMLMAIRLNGFSTNETQALTEVMLNSGTIFDFQDPRVIDKHSTGGIGDKTSFILAPIAHAAGVKVPMIAGRGLGHTAGTVDKIEAVEGFRTSLSLDEFKKSLTQFGLVLMGQTDQIAPADKIIYALRDVTATVDSIPLITASIMSKKLAEGTAGLVFDVKCGNGAFMKTKSDAKKLAKGLMSTAKRYHKKSLALVTNMNQPLGNAVGHANEIQECIDTLKGHGPTDLTELSLQLAGAMIYLAGITKSLQAGVVKAKKMIQSGQALNSFYELIKRQGGNLNSLENLPAASEQTIFLAPRNGYIKSFQTETIGKMIQKLGGGRTTAGSQIDLSIGLFFHKKIGDKVKKGEALVTIYHHQNQKNVVENLLHDFKMGVIKLSSSRVEKPELIYQILENKI